MPAALETSHGLVGGRFGRRRGRKQAPFASLGLQLQAGVQQAVMRLPLLGRHQGGRRGKEQPPSASLGPALQASVQQALLRLPMNVRRFLAGAFAGAGSVPLGAQVVLP